MGVECGREAVMVMVAREGGRRIYKYVQWGGGLGGRESECYGEDEAGPLFLEGGISSSLK